MDRIADLRLGLVTTEHKSRLEGLQASLQHLPGIIDRQQQHTIAEMLDRHLVATEVLLLRQAHRLTGA